MTLDFSITTAMLASGLASAVLALALLYLSSVPDAPGATRWWAAAFLLNTLRHAVVLCGGMLSLPVCVFLSESAQAGTAILLIAGALRYERTVLRQTWVLVAMPLVVAWAAVFTMVHPHFLLLTGPLYGLSGIAMLYVGWSFIRERPPYARHEHIAVGVAFLAWGLHKLDYPLLRPITALAPFGFMLAEVLTMIIAVGLIMVVQRRQQYRVEEATRRAQASEAGRVDSEARYRDLVDNNVMGVVVHREGVPVYVNDAFLRIFGFDSFEQIAGVDVTPRIADPSEVERLHAYAKARLKGEPAPSHYEYRARRTDGKPLWIHNTVRRIQWQGQPALQAMVYDVTEQKRAEEEVRSSQRLLRTVIDTIPHFVSVRDRDARVLMVNRAWLDASGKSLEEVLHKNPVEARIEPAREREAFLRECLEVVRTEAPLRSEYEGTIHGERHRFDTIRTPLRGEDGSVVGVVSVSADITEQKRTEEELRSSQRLLRTVIDSMPHFVSVRDREARLLMVNKALQDVLAVPPERYLYKDPIEADIREREDAEKFMQQTLEVVNSGKTIESEYEISLGSQRRLFQTVRTPLVGDDGSVVGVVSLSVDVTEQRNAEDELRASQRLLRTVIDSLPHVVIVRNREGRMLMANRAWQHAFQSDPADYLYKTATELSQYVPEEARKVHEATLETIASERTMEHEHEMTTHHGVRRYHTIRMPLHGVDGSVVGAVTTSLDITEQRIMEEQLRQAQKMEAVGQLTGGVAHDFNNLLSIVLGNLELLESRVTGDERALSYAGRAKRATERGAALTQRLLAFSRRQTLQPQAVNLTRHVGELLELLRSSLGETIRIETDCNPAAGEVLVDPVQLENTLLNLALNARDAMPEGGTLSIRVAAGEGPGLPGVPAQDQPEHGWVVLTVHDTGVGMTEDVLARAVEPFFTTKDAGSGSGLGLSMIYGFMTQSGGHLHMESKPGAGTTVRLYFRRNDSPREASGVQAAAEPHPLGTAETVLVVEDDPALGHLAVEMLAELNYTAIKASDGLEALEILRRHPHIGLLFTDVVLPNGMNGVMLAEEALRLRPDLKVLFTSGYAETVFERYPIEIEGADLVHKPYRLGDLARKLNNVLGGGPATPS